MFTKTSIQNRVFGGSAFGSAGGWNSLRQFQKVAVYRTFENAFGKFYEISADTRFLLQGNEGEFIRQEELTTLEDAVNVMGLIKDAIYDALGHDGDDELLKEMKAFLWEKDALEEYQGMIGYDDEMFT